MFPEKNRKEKDVILLSRLDIAHFQKYNYLCPTFLKKKV